MITVRFIVFYKDGSICNCWEREVNFRKDGSSKSLADLFADAVRSAPVGTKIEMDFMRQDGIWNSQA